MNNRKLVPVPVPVRQQVPVNDSSSAFLHQMERRLCHMVHNHMTGKAWYQTASNYTKNKEDSICIIGRDRVLVQSMVLAVEQLQKRWCSRATLLVRPIRFVKVQDNTYDGDLAGAKSVMLCCSGDLTQDLHLMCQVLRQCLQRGATLCCAIINDMATRNVRSISTYTQQFPELKWLVRCRRLLVISERSEGLHVDGESEEVLKEWLADTHFDHWLNPDKVLNFHDILKMSQREAGLVLPERDTVLRLSVMSLFGTLSVILTLILLCFAANDSGLDRQVERARRGLQEALEAARGARSDWSGTHDGVALLALQLHNPAWCFTSVSNQRSVDRLEISVLAVLSRSRGATSGRELTVSSLAHDINALLSVHQDPRDFHGHDLVALLEIYLLQKAPFGEHSAFSMSLAVLALCNAKVELKLRHVDTLISRQRKDGSYLNGPDEVAVSAMALSCARDAVPEAGVAMNRAVAFLRGLRRNDGSYGSIYTTSLVLQAFNASNILLRDMEYESTTMWLVKQLNSKLVQENPDVAGQVLIALAGKSMVLNLSDVSDFLKTLGIKKPETDASKARKRGKVPPITVQPEDNKVDMVSVHDPHVHASSSQDRRAEEQNKTVMQEQEKTSDTAEPEVSPQDSPLDADLKSKETPNIAHATEDAATPKHVVDEAKANTRSGFASFFGWGSDDNGDDDDDDDDDLPSTKHGSYRKKA